MIERRRGAYNRLREQLKKGTKTKKKTTSEEVPLTERDQKRIEKEIEILKSRI